MKKIISEIMAKAPSRDLRTYGVVFSERAVKIMLNELRRKVVVDIKKAMRHRDREACTMHRYAEESIPKCSRCRLEKIVRDLEMNE